MTRCLTGASPIGWRRVDSPASVFCIAIGHCIGKVINALMTVTVLAGS